MTSDDMTSDEKRQAHWLKAKQAVLQQAVEKGGTASLGDLHSYAESHWFIAHERFSQLMEECVDENLLTFADNEFSITDQGRSLGADS